MKARYKIPISLVEKHAQDVCFLVDNDITYVQVARPRVRWLKALPHEVNIKETSIAIKILLLEEIDTKAQGFGTYDETKARITTTLKVAMVDRMKNKILKRLQE